MHNQKKHYAHYHAIALRQIFNGINKIHAGILHQKSDRSSMRAAAKTMVKLLGRANRKARRFFIMKGAQTHEVCATLLELDVFTHHIDNIDAGE